MAANAGNPQKVQRYALEWAHALRAMSALDPEVLLPGHGLPIAGADDCRMVLDDTATLLESLVEQTLALMNDGARLDDVLHAVRPPAGLTDKPHLRPIYDEPEFVVRNTWRLYGGWYDGNPARLHPAPDASIAAEVAALAGGPGALAARALELADAGDLRLSGQLAEWAAQAAPTDAAAHDARAEINRRRRDEATSLMAKGIYTWAEDESRSALRDG
jgi:alkyl sulfatase BDS1-like metallo-beta-lactamase superfamily hydrolase